MFQRRHYIAIAALLKDACSTRMTYFQLAGAFSDLFEADNLNFDRDKFYDAICTKGEPK